ncbi:MAG TPA: hypothetical protein VGD99_20625 [Anaerolineae bacterium]|jgi:hypothetical protein
MKNQTTVSHPIHACRGYLDRKHFTRYLIVAASMIVALIMSACGTALPVAENQPDELSAAEQTNRVEEGTGVQRAFDADAARYSGLANAYLSENETNGQQALDAEVARYSGLAARYSTENEIGPSLPFDIEHLRQIYDANWGVEADAADVRRTVQPIKGNVASEPPAFDIEHLRQIYDANWGVEADAADVRRTVQPTEGNGAGEPPTFDIAHLRQIYDANWGVEGDAVDVNPANRSSAFLAANPELALAQRYTGMVEWHKLHHPGR